MKRFIFIAILAFLFAGVGAVATDTDIGAKSKQELVIESYQADISGITTLAHATGHVDYVSVFQVQPEPDFIWPAFANYNKFLLPNNQIITSGNTTLNPNDILIGEPINFT